ncbi:cytochrome P450 [Pisolithus marmoratus]|nr:cytochrome P450 [Pisolithus marmoratus]
MTFLLTLGATCAAIVGLWVLSTRAKAKLPYPPGPKGLPFIGSVLDIDSQRPHHTYTQWAKTYADGRSEIYSDRYRSPIFRIYGIDRMTALLEYGNEWKIHRKLFHLSLRNNVVDKYNDLYLNYARQLFQNILCDSSKLFDHIDLCPEDWAASRGKDDPTFAMANGLVHMINKEMTADKIGLLNVMPFRGYIFCLFQYLPSWFPGAGFKRNSGRCRKMVSDVVEVLFTMAKTEIDGGVDESLAKAAISGLYLDCFRVENPSEEELYRLLQIDQRLPYLQAVLYETLRWNPPGPLGNRAMKDHGYDGSDRFDPTRHLTSDGELSPQARQNYFIFFGFGKRVCPGRFFADHSIWVATAIVLSALKFEKAKDLSGKYIEVEPVFPSSVISCPAPFPCSVTSRLV